MATYVQLGAVKTWYDEHGQGDPLVLLHGGLVDARFFAPNLPALAEHFHLSTPERRGHGHTPDVEGPITYQLMTDDTIALLDTVVTSAIAAQRSAPLQAVCSHSGQRPHHLSLSSTVDEAWHARRGGSRPAPPGVPREGAQLVKCPPKMSELPKVAGQSELGAGVGRGLSVVRDWR
jgi:hypothetical protein